MFKNFSSEDFSWKWDGVVYTFKVGQEIYLEDFKADHFAKHLVDRELTRQNIPTDMLDKRAALLVQCFPTQEEVTPVEAMQLNEKAKKTSKKVEPEFEDLQVKPKKNI